LVIGTRLVESGMTFENALFVLIRAPEIYLPIRQVGVHFHDSADGLAAAEAAFAQIDRGLAQGVPGPSISDNPARRRVRSRPSNRLPARDASTAMFQRTPVTAASRSGASGSRIKPLGPSIHASALTFRYPDADQPLGPYDLELSPGQIVALAGPSGGGKSTLIHLIMGFIAPTDGELLLGGVSADQLDWDDWRAGSAFVDQIPCMVPGTIADNVRLGFAAANDVQVDEALAMAGAAHLEAGRWVGEDGEGLSIGERRRVGLARAIARISWGGASLLVLDEPTAGLDWDTEATILANLRQLGVTALVVSHRPAVLAMADQVVDIGDSSAESLQATPGRLSAGAATASLRTTDQRQASALLAPALVTATVTTASADQEAMTAITDQATPDPQGITSVNQPGCASSNVGESSALGEPADLAMTAADRQRGSLPKLVLRLLDAVPAGRWRLIAAVLLAAAASGAAVGLMGVSAWLISRAAEHPPFLELSVAAVGVRFCGIARGCFRYVERLVGHDLALSMQAGLRLRVYQALARTTLLGRRQGDLLVRAIADVNAIDDVMVRIVQPFAAASLVVLACCLVLGHFSAPAALALAASAVIAGWVIPWLAGRVSRRADQAAVPLRGALGELVHDLSRTAVDQLAYGHQNAALASLAKVDERLRRLEQRAAWAGGIGAGLQTVAAGAAVIAGLVIGAFGVEQGTLPAPMLAVLVLTPLALHEVFANFAQAAQTWTRAQVALGRVNDLLAAPAIGSGDVDQASSAQEPELLASDLGIGWPGHSLLASGLNFELLPGQALAVMGPSGSGKTTLAATIIGQIPIRQGLLERRGRIGYLAQDAHVFATTVAENVRIGNKDASDAQVLVALAEAGLAVDPQRLVGEFGAGLSGGELRRLALARLFVGDYRLLVLDEPTEHLDQETAKTLIDDIFAGLERRPVLVITHDEAVAARCTGLLRFGRTVAVAS
ncbi:MAG: thiol reductant ABC exporter subunit CydC, partial [Propionibacteriaceae bacterium]|jgi:ATP-binding cassette subfamily C protein CydCD|nr:thiol reductant ABC exporter subunit CydC [Propionibacteriaceae bacterium]